MVHASDQNASLETNVFQQKCEISIKYFITDYYLKLYAFADEYSEALIALFCFASIS